MSIAFSAQHVAANWRLWRNCEAVIGRYYENADRTVGEWIERFRGTVQQPLSDDHR
jgi:hypothetical protein